MELWSWVHTKMDEKQAHKLYVLKNLADELVQEISIMGRRAADLRDAILKLYNEAKRANRSKDVGL